MMRIPSIFLFFFILFFSSCFPIMGKDHKDILPLNEIKPGMKATAKTVFKGFQIEEFDLEIIGVLKNVIGPGQHVILAKLIGDKVSFSGVVAGMSGSPVYIKNKLIGAIAYRFGIFQKEPVAGITPIENMLEVEKYSTSLISSSNSDENIAHKSLLPEMNPIVTPLVFGGLHQSVFHHYEGYFKDWGFLPLQGGGSPHAESKEGPFEPGAAVAALLVIGDIDIAGTGTLTYRSGNKVLAFGHPFFRSGPVEMPMARAEILHTMASSMASFKLSNTADIIGTILQDRLTAVEGQIGVKPRMIPIEVSVENKGMPLKDFHYEMIKHKRLSPTLLSITISNSLFNTLFYLENISILANLNIAIENCPTMRFIRLYTTEEELGILPFTLAGDISHIFSRIFKNRFEEPVIEKITVSLDVREGVRSASLEKTWYDKDKARKGDKINIKAYFKGFRGEIFEENFELIIPADVTHRRVKVAIGSSLTIDHLQGKIFQKKLKQARDLNDFIRTLNEQPLRHEMVLILSEPSMGAILRGQPLPNLPPSIASVLYSERGDRNISKMYENVLFKIVRPMDFNISGVQTFYIDIE